MPKKPRSRCTSCKALHGEPGSKCPGCKALARREWDARRPSPAARGYTGRHRSHFRPEVLKRDPVCVCKAAHCPHDGPCSQPSIVADHHPWSRRELVAMGMDPDDPTYGRGLCKGCHDRHTARAQPGGWNQAKGAS